MLLVTDNPETTAIILEVETMPAAKGEISWLNSCQGGTQTGRWEVAVASRQPILYSCLPIN